MSRCFLIAAEEGLIEMKEVAIDGTKMLADASKHRAMSYQYMCDRELELRSEIKALMSEKNTKGSQPRLSTVLVSGAGVGSE